jgi:hypothetical protein
VDITSNTFCKCTATFRTHCISSELHKSKRSRLTSTSPVRNNQTQSAHTSMNALILGCLRHCYQISSLKCVHGLKVKGVHFTMAPITVALPHRKPTSAETSLNICVSQNGDRINALYMFNSGPTRCTLYTLLLSSLALHVSGAICNHHQEHNCRVQP